MPASAIATRPSNEKRRRGTTAAAPPPRSGPLSVPRGVARTGPGGVAADHGDGPAAASPGLGPSYRISALARWAPVVLPDAERSAAFGQRLITEARWPSRSP